MGRNLALHSPPNHAFWAERVDAAAKLDPAAPTPQPREAPRPPRTPTATDAIAGALRAHPEFEGFTRAELRLLAPLFDWRTFAPGEPLARQGDRDQRMLLLLDEGTVEISRMQECGDDQVRQVLWETTAKACLGQHAFAIGRPYATDVHAVTEVRALVTNPGRLGALPESQGALKSKLVATLVLGRLG